MANESEGLLDLAVASVGDDVEPANDPAETDPYMDWHGEAAASSSASAGPPPCKRLNKDGRPRVRIGVKRDEYHTRYGGAYLQRKEPLKPPAVVMPKQCVDAPWHRVRAPSGPRAKKPFVVPPRVVRADDDLSHI